MKKTITKAKIIEAMMTEPLRSNKFFHGNELNTCPVCAVGAVLRKASFVASGKITDEDNAKIVGKVVTNYSYSAGSPARVKNLIERRNYLGALSVYFESMLCPEDNDSIFGKEVDAQPKHRKRLVRFVEKNFPNKLTIEI